MPLLILPILTHWSLTFGILGVYLTGSFRGSFAATRSEAIVLKVLWTIMVILLILWLLGFSFHVGGGLIHIVLVVAVIVLIYNLVSGRRAV